ncbi:hypothetical protein D3C86_1800640 [compost metagenome]
MVPPLFPRLERIPPRPLGASLNMSIYMFAAVHGVPSGHSKNGRFDASLVYVLPTIWKSYNRKFGRVL